MDQTGRSVKAMQYTKLGNTDIEVSKLCIGCMSFGKAGTMHDLTLNETDLPLKSGYLCGNPAALAAPTLLGIPQHAKGRFLVIGMISP